MSILKVNDIRRATTGSGALVINDPIIITTGSVSASTLVGSIPGAVTLADASIGKEKLTNDARDWVNILNKPNGMITSSTQVISVISASTITPSNITASGVIYTQGTFSGSGASLLNIPNSALVNNTITINGVATALGASRTLVTNDIAESVNLYYTDARVKAKLNVEGVVSSSGQINYQSIIGQPGVNTLGSDGNNAFTITAGIFLTGSTGINLTTDSANAKIILRTTGGTVSSSTQIQQGLPANVVSSSAQVKANLPADTVSSSIQIKANLPADTVSSSTQVLAFLPTNTVSSSTQVKTFLPDGSVSSSAQYPGWVTASSQVDVRNTTGISTIATTGSNTFIGNQTISGSTTITGNLLVQGTSSVLYTTSSQLDVGTNKITLNTTSTLRYGGLSIVDSGSTNNQSGSLYWDSVHNVWLFVHAGTTNTSSIIITGPENTGLLGNETFLTTNLLTKAGVSGDHIVDSQISDNGTIVGITGNLKVTGSITASGFDGVSYTNLLNIPGNIVSSSTQVKTFLPADTVSSSTQVKTFLPADTVSSSTQVKQFLPNGTISSSIQVTATSTTGFTTGVEQVMKDNNVHSGSFLGTATTNNLSEGFTNLYYTDARVKTKLNAEAVHSGSSLGTATTTNLAEGTNLYFTNPRVVSALPANTLSSSLQVRDFLPANTVSSSAQINLAQAFNTASQALTASYAMVTLGTTATNTDTLPEGSTNLYYTDTRVKTKLNVENVHSASFLGTATTTNLTEGVNLYFTNPRVVNALPIGTVSSSTQVSTLLPAGTVSSSGQVDVRNTTGIGTLATTGSNTFVGNQTITGSLLTNADTLIFYGQMTVSGSLVTTGSIINTAGGFTGSFSGTHTGTFPYASLTGIPSSIVSSSTQVVAAIAGQTIAPSIINATGAISGASIQTSGNIVTTNGSFIFKDAITSNTYAFRGLSGIITLDGGSQYPTGWNFQYANSSNSAMYITSSGNVGIGTTSPASKLEITGGNLRLSQGQGSAGSFGRLEWQNTLAYSSTVRAYIEGLRTSEGDNGFIDFATSEGTNIAPVVRMTINRLGNVGINDSSPGTKLVVSNQGTIDTSTPGTTLYNLHFTGLSTNDYAQGITFNGGSTGAHAGLYVQGSGAYGTKMYFATTDNYGVGSKTRMMIDHLGFVGVGTTAPNDKLDVRGSLRVGSGVKANDMGATNYIVVSTGTIGQSTGLEFFTNDGTYNPRAWITHTHSAGAQALTFNSIYSSGTGYANFNFLNGNVGIGTTSPSYKLDVAGTIALSGFPFAVKSGNYNQLYEPAGNTAIYLGNATDPGNYYDNSTHWWRNRGGSTTYMFLNSSGNLGIGTTSIHDSAKLEVRSGKIVAGTATSVGGSVILQGYYTDGALTVLGSEFSNGGPILGYAVKPSTSAAGAFLSATGINIPRGAYGISGLTHTWSGGGVQTVAIDSAVTMQTLMTLDSNVLRVNQDQARIHISSSVSTNTSYAYITNAGGTLYMGKENSAGSAFSTTPYASFINAADTYPLVFMVNATERARITNGNVFSTTGAVSASGAISGSKFKVGGGDDASISNGVIGAFNPSGLSRVQMFTNASAGRLDFITTENLDFVITHGGTGRIRVKNAGDISLAVNTSVTGSMTVTTSLAVGGITPSVTTGRIDASNDIVAYSSSDIRLKNNVNRIESSLDKILKLSGVEFEWKQDPDIKIHHGYDEGTDLGLIAQEVEEVFPQIVQNRDNGYKAVRYERLIPVLIEAIRELKAEIDILKNSK